MVLKGLIQDSMEQGVTKAYPTPPLCALLFTPRTINAKGELL